MNGLFVLAPLPPSWFYLSLYFYYDSFNSCHLSGDPAHFMSNLVVGSSIWQLFASFQVFFLCPLLCHHFLVVIFQARFCPFVSLTEQKRSSSSHRTKIDRGRERERERVEGKNYRKLEQKKEEFCQHN